MSCAVFTLIGLWAALKNKSRTWFTWATFGAAATMIFLASFLAWRDEHRGRIVAESKIQELTATHFTGSIDQMAVAPMGRKQADCLITLIARIVNTGAPSVADHMGVSIAKGGKYLEEVMPLPAPPAGIRLLEGEANSPSISFPSSDYLPRKAEVQPIPTGGAVVGFVQVYVKGLTKEEAISKDVTVRLVFSDVRGQTFHIENEGTPVIIHLPNVPDIIRENNLAK